MGHLKLPATRRGIFLGFAAAFAAGFLSAEEKVFTWRKVPNNAFKVGESIVYVVKYGVIPAGFATLQVRGTEQINGRPAYYVISKAYTNKAMDLVFKVRDKNETWIDTESISSVRYYQRIREGFYRRENRTDYDQPKGRFVYTKKRKGKETTTEGEIPAFVQDVLSSLYYVRTRKLEVGGKYSFHANSGGKTWPLTVNVQKIQKIRVPAGRFECVKIEPILAGEGIFQHEGKLEVWMTNDERHIPVLLRSRVLVGAFDAEMKEYRTDGTSEIIEEADTKVREEEEGELGVEEPSTVDPRDPWSAH
jgi:hypothetical protein